MLCAAVDEIRSCRLSQLAVHEVASVFVHAQQLGNGQPPDLADDENIQPAVVGHCLRPGQEAAAIRLAVADGAHQAVHGQGFLVDGEGQRPADAAAQLLHDGEQIRRLSAAQRDAPELRDTIGHLSVQARRADGGGQTQVRLEQIDGHFPACQLRVQVCKLFLCAVGAQKVVAAAVGQASDRRTGDALHPGHRLHKGAVASGGIEAEWHALRCGLLCRCAGQFPRVPGVFGDVDRDLFRGKARPPGSGFDLRNELGRTVLLARGGVQ